MSEKIKQKWMLLIVEVYQILTYQHFMKDDENWQPEWKTKTKEVCDVIVIVS